MQRNESALRSRLCWYDDSWDGNYYMCRVGDASNLFVAAGSSGHGFKFAPLLGEIMADVVEGKPNEFAGRFAWRAPEKRKIEACRSDGAADPVPLEEADGKSKL